MAEGGLWDAVYLEQHSDDLCIAFSLLIRNGGKQSSLSVLDNSHCVWGLLLTEWQATQIYFLQPPWQVWSFMRKINQLLQFLAVLFHIILMARALIRFDAFIDRYILNVPCFQPSDLIKFFPIFSLPWLTSFSLSLFPAWVKALFCRSWDRKMRICFLEHTDGEIVAISSDNILKNITGQSVRRIVVETHIPPIVFSMPILCVLRGWWCFLDSTKRCFVFSVLSAPWSWRQTFTKPNLKCRRSTEI